MAVTLSRELVVDTARRQLERDGSAELSLRAVARELGVTAPALYAYVDDKRELMAAVATDHFERLIERFEAVEETDPLARVRAVSRAYVDHAVASPALFRLMFRYPPSTAGEVEAFPPATRAFEVASAAMTDAMARGLLGVSDVTVACMVMWAAMHGLAEILLMGFGFDDAGAEQLIAATIDTMLAGLVEPGTV
ncbi:MAG TPA: TetR/AcrR family transcriptional regulator [Acidimicrobiales bacterium]|nr:TetR/AcrR family transcriptional regulator [Acidimicrobiales bacterium]